MSYFRHVFVSSSYCVYCVTVIIVVSIIVGILVNAKTETVQHGPARRAGTFASLLYKAEKPSVRLSVCLSAFLVGSISRPYLHGSKRFSRQTKRPSFNFMKFVERSF